MSLVVLVFFSMGLCRNPMKILIPTINDGALKIITRNQLFVFQNRVLKFKSGDLLKSMKTKHHHLTCTSLTLKKGHHCAIYKSYYPRWLIAMEIWVYGNNFESFLAAVVVLEDRTAS